MTTISFKLTLINQNRKDATEKKLIKKSQKFHFDELNYNSYYQHFLLSLKKILIYKKKMSYIIFSLQKKNFKKNSEQKSYF